MLFPESLSAASIDPIGSGCHRVNAPVVYGRNFIGFDQPPHGISQGNLTGWDGIER
jgi:hypothetical protein